MKKITLIVFHIGFTCLLTLAVPPETFAVKYFNSEVIAKGNKTASSTFAEKSICSNEPVLVSTAPENVALLFENFSPKTESAHQNCLFEAAFDEKASTDPCISQPEQEISVPPILSGDKKLIANAHPQNPAKSGIFVETGIVLPGIYSCYGNTSTEWGDYDNDGDLDLLIAGYTAVYGHNNGIRLTRLYRNDGNDTFTEVLTGSFPDYGDVASQWGDYNNNGYLDIFFNGHDDGAISSRLFKSINGNSFEEILSNDFTPVYCGSVDWGDYNNNGKLDLVFSGDFAWGIRITEVYQNFGNDSLVKQEEINLAGAGGELAMGSSSTYWADYNNDGRLDVFVGGFSIGGGVAKLYRNEGNNSFVEEVGFNCNPINVCAAAWGDYNADGHLDLILAGHFNGEFVTKLFRNLGNGVFSEIENLNIPGVTHGSIDWGDYDLDGDLDLLITGNTGSEFISRIYENDNGVFIEDVINQFPGVHKGSGKWVDYDNDGDLDILISGHTGTEAICKLFRNEISITNSPPSKPTGVSFVVSESNVEITWDAATDDKTPSAGLSYNFYLKNSQNQLVYSPMSNLMTGVRKIAKLGNAGMNASWVFTDLPDDSYYFAVQALDNSYIGSSFSIEANFHLGEGGGENYYWVNGSGFWNDPNMWSHSSGGPGGAGVPTSDDNVFFDANSFPNFENQVMLEGTPAQCNNMNWTGVTNFPKLIGVQPLYIHGNLLFINQMTVDYSGTTYFNATNKTATITMNGQAIPNAAVFEGQNGIWEMTDDFRAAGSISLLRGHLKTNNFNVTCYRFNSNPTNKAFNRVLDIGSSVITIQFADDGANAIFSCNLNNDLATLSIFSSGNSLFDFIGQDPQGSNLSTMLAAKELNFDDITFHGNGKLVAENDTFRDVLFMANGTLYVDECNFRDVEIYQTGRAYSNHTQYENFLFSTHPGWCGSCNDCRPANDGIFEGDSNEVSQLIEYNRNGYLIGAGNIADTCRFLANGSILAGENQFRQLQLKRNFVVGCNNFLGYIAFPDTLTLQEGVTQFINDSIVLLPEYYCNHPVITSTSQTVQANILSDNPFSLDYAEIQGIHANNTNFPLTPNSANRSVDMGNNTNWAFSNYIPLGTVSVTITCVTPCSNSTNGKVTIHATGGAKPYKYYRWIPSGAGFWQMNSNNGFDSTFINLAKQQYLLRVTDFYGCNYDFNVQICGPDPVVLDSVNVIPIPCYNNPPNSNGEIIIHAHGGSGYLQYSIDNGNSYQLDNHFTDVGIGDYIIKVADSAFCVSDTTHVTMTQRPQLWLTAFSEAVICPDDSTGKLNVSVWGGTPPYDLVITNTLTGEEIIDFVPVPHDLTDPLVYFVKAGNYSFLLTDANECDKTMSTTVFQPDPIDFTYTLTTVAGTPTTYCVEIFPTGGNGGPFDYLWNNGATASLVCDLLPGTHCLTIFDALDCPLEACILIDSLQLNMSYDVFCFGALTPLICANAAGGTPPYIYMWSTGSTTPCISNRPPGLYWVDVTDDNGNGATVRDSIFVIENPQIVADFLIDTVSCYGLADGSITIIPSGGTPFSDGSYLLQWYDSSTQPTISGLPEGAYSVTVTDSIGCTQDFNIAMSQPDPLQISFTTGMADCDNQFSYWAQAIVTGGVQSYTYSWQPAWVNGANTDLIWDIPTGTYNLTIHDSNGCEVTGSVTIEPLAISVNYENVLCYGDSTGWASAIAFGGNEPYSYIWSSPEWMQDSTTSSVENLWPGNYTISVADGNGCIINQTITILQPLNQLTFNIFNFDDNQNTCYGDCNGWAGAAAGGGTPPYDYLWTNLADPLNPIGSGNNISSLCAGQYKLTITDNSGCSIDTTFVIIEPDQIVIQDYTVTSINCFSDGDIGQIQFNVISGGSSTYLYSIDDGVSSQFSNSFVNLSPGNYVLKVLDLSNPSCTSPSILDTITRPPAQSITFNPIIFPTGAGLNNGSITASGSGGVPPYTHNWYLDGLPFSIGQNDPSTISNLFAGVYVNEIFDANGCVFIDSVHLIEPDELSIDYLFGNVTCFGKNDGWIEIFPSGGVPPYAILWSHGAPAVTKIENLMAGIYTVNVTDSNGNTAFLTVTIIEPDPIKIQFQTNTVCYGETNGWIKANALYGTPNYQHHWSNGMVGDSIFGLAPNQWYVDTVYDSQGCFTYDSVFINENPLLRVEINNLKSSVCKGDSLQLEVDVFGGSYPYIYSWTPTTGVSDTSVLRPKIAPLVPTMYYIEVTDLIGCKAYDSIFVTIDSIPIANFYFENECGSNIVQFYDNSNDNGSSIASWLWEFGDGFMSPLENPVHYYATSGMFNISLTVTSTEGCQDTFTNSVLVDPMIDVDFIFDTVCFNHLTNFQALSLNPSTIVQYWNWYINDNPPIQVFDPVNTLDYQFTYAGLHSVKLEMVDINGCSGGILKEVLVRVLPQTDFTYYSTCDNNNVDFFDQTIAGSGSLTSWFWEFGDTNTSYDQNPSHSYGTNGIYPVTLTVNNEFGCTNSFTKEVFVNPSPIADFNADTTCFGSLTYFFDQSSIDVGFITSWKWNFGDINSPNNTSSIQNPVHLYTNTGDFSVTLIANTSNNCSDTIVKQVFISNKPTSDFSFTTPCIGNAPTEFTDLSVLGDTPIIHWHWEFGDGNSSTLQSPEHSYLLSGQYHVTLWVEDESGCQNSKTSLITVHHLPTAQFSYSNNCMGYQTSFFDYSNGGGANIISWLWDFNDGLGSVSTLQNPTHIYNTSGYYNVSLSISNSNGCQNVINQIIEILPTPSADFSVDNQCVNSTLHFNDQSYSFGSVVTSWNWSFGDGNFSTDPNPLHSYSQPGNYWVTLWVSNLQGCIADTGKFVSVYPLPIADFDYLLPTCENDTVWFYDMSSSVGSSPITQWLWDFGDGVTSILKNPGHKFTHGNHNVSLKITNSNGCEKTISKIIGIADKPNAIFTHEMSSCEIVQFFDLSNTLTGQISFWIWNFGDPYSGGNNFSYQQNPQHSYYFSGNYEVQLIVFNAHGCSDTISHEILIQKPTADFTFSDACEDTIVHFTDLSISPDYQIIQWEWEFGDGNVSIAQNPLHIYDLAGIYIVNLKVMNSIGCSSTFSEVIIIEDRPTGKFTYLGPSCINDTVQFIDQSYCYQGTSITHWHWDFGDPFFGQSTSTIQNPMYKYSAPGDYVVTLVVTADNGCTAFPFVKNIEVHQNPVASFIYEIEDCSMVHFTNLSVPLADSLSTFNWNFGDPSSGFFNYSSIKNPSHYYYENGFYEVILTVTNSNGCSDTVTINIEIEKPFADFNYFSSDTCSNNTIYFNDLSYSLNNSIESWKWDLGDGSPPSILQNPSHNYLAPGTYYVSLTVWDASDCMQNIVKQIIVKSSPIANFTSNAPNCYGDTIQFTDLSQSTYGSNQITSWLWDFGDSNTSIEQHPSHYFSTSGTRYVRLIVQDINGCFDSIVKPVNIVSKPVAAFEFDHQTCNTVNFTDFSFDNTNPITSWLWNFGDPTSGWGNQSNLQNPQHTFYQAGTYTVTLVVSNDQGCFDTKYKTVSIDIPFVEFTVTNSCDGVPAIFDNLSYYNNGVIQSWLWEFGDGNTSTLPNPTHLYNSPGIYYVKLTANTNDGCTNFKIKPVEINIAPEVDFSFSSNCVGNTTEFYGQVFCPYCVIIEWTWDFDISNPGQHTSTLQNPTHSYLTPGNYIASLKVLTSDNCENTITKNVLISPAIEADFNYTNTCLGDATQFEDASVSFGSPIDLWIWDFGSLQQSFDQNPIFTFPTVGNYLVELIVMNVSGCYDTIIQNVEITDSPTVSFSGLPPIFCLNSNPVILTGSETPYGVFSGPGITDNENGTAWFTPAIAGVGGPYTIEYAYQDFNCTGLAYGYTEVKNDPIADFVAQYSNCQFDTIWFYDVSTTYDGLITQWEWNFDDGSAPVMIYPPESPNIGHAYNEPGTFNVSLSIKTTNNCEDIAVKQIAVNPVPDADFTIEQGSNCIGTSVNFQDISDPNASFISSWLWNFGDNNFSNLQNPIHQYDLPGSYSVTLQIINSNYCSDQIIQDLHIYEPPAVDFLFDTVCFGNTTSLWINSDSTSIGLLNNWWWIIDNETIAGNQVLSYTFNQSGYHEVILKVESADNCINQKTKSVLVNPLPSAAFNHNFMAGGCSNQNIQFYDISQPNGEIETWHWDFGDGTSASNLQNPAHIFAPPVLAYDTVYTVELTVCSYDNCCSAFSEDFIVKSPPIAGFEFNSYGLCPDNMISFWDSSIPRAESLISWMWNFDDPGSGDNNISYLEQPLHSFSQPGMYLVKLIVQNSNYCFDTIQKPVNISNYPAVNFEFDTVCMGNATNFSIDPNITDIPAINNVLWDFGGATSNQFSPSHVFPESGLWPVVLNITDTLGCEGSIQLNAIVQALPQVDFVVLPGQYNCSGDSIQFIDQSYTSNSSEIVWWEWDFGDGSSLSNEQNPLHYFNFTEPSQQLFYVSLMVKNADSCLSSIMKPILVNKSPDAEFTTESLCFGTQTLFTDFSVANSGIITHWSWSFGDGSFSTNQNPVHEYTQPGEYIVSLTVTNSNSCQNTNSRLIKIKTPEFIDFSYEKVCFGDLAYFQIEDSVNIEAIDNFFWDFGNNQTSNVASPPGIFYEIDTIYHVTLSIIDTIGCENQITKPLYFNPLPNVYDIKGGGSYCFGDDGLELTLDWSEPSINYELLLDGLGMNPPLIIPGVNFELSFGLLNEPGNYSIMAVNQVTGCQQMMGGVSMISFFEPYSVEIGNDTTICANHEILLTASPSEGNYTDYTYEWWNDFGLNLPPLHYVVAYSPNITNQVIQYGVEVTNKITGCAVRDTISIDFVICDGVEEYLHSSSIKVFPNPATDRIFLHFDYLHEDVEISILSLNSVFLQKELIAATGEKAFFTEFDVSAMPKGISIIRVSGTITNKFFKIVLY
jgi:PKD repeat protein